MKVRLDSDLRRNNQGTALIGGSPTRLLRLSPAGARLLDGWAAGEPVGRGAAETKLATRLLDAGMIHPVVSAVDAVGSGVVVGVVIPVLNDVDGLDATLRSVRRDVATETVVVVDDGSMDGAAVRAVAERYDARVIHHDVNSGPAAARNTGWRALTEKLGHDGVVAFIDADVELCVGSLDLLRAHFASGLIGAVAPRVRASAGPTVLDRYEAVRSPLDLGSEPARVRTGSRVSYVPAAALLVRVSVLEEMNGFVESMRSGEDVDFVWRVDRSGSQVRYEPAAVVNHRNRLTLLSLARQRRFYGSAAADLAERHPGDVAPVAASRPMFAIWATLMFGPVAGKILAAGGALALAKQLHDVVRSHSDEPVVEAARVSGQSHASLARWLATASTRTWLPLLGVVSLFSRRVRRWLIASLVVPAAVDWVKERPALDPFRFMALRTLDDAAYCAGVVQGAVGRRSVKALLPRFLPTGAHRVDG